MSDVKASEIQALMDRTHDALHMAEPSPAGQSLDGGSNREADDETYAEWSDAYGPVVINHPDDMEKIDWSEPNPDDLARALPGALHEWGDDLEVHETWQEGDGLVSVLARWKGMEGGFHVRFGQWQEDML